MKVLTTSDVVLLGVLASAEIVTVYRLTQFLPEALVSSVAIVVFGISPGLGGIIGAGNYRKANRVRGEAMLLTWLIVTIAGSTILIWNDAFLELWVGAEYQAGSNLTFWILLMSIQLILIRNDGNIIDLTLDLRHKVILGAISSAISVVTAAVLVAWLRWGAVGVCLAFITGRLLMTIGYPLIVGKVLNCNGAAQLRAAIRPVLTTLATFLLAMRVQQHVLAQSWLALVIGVMATLVVVSLLVLVIGVTSSQRRQILHRVNLVFSNDRAKRKEL
jgi:O-antigen/teichoic acid export membrane protein